MARMISVVVQIIVLILAILCVALRLQLVIVRSRGMEPNLTVGDIVLIKKTEDPIDVGEIIKFDIPGYIPVVHRVIRAWKDSETEETKVITKGDANVVDDRAFLGREHGQIKGKVVGVLGLGTRLIGSLIIQFQSLIEDNIKSVLRIENRDLVRMQEEWDD